MRCTLLFASTLLLAVGQFPIFAQDYEPEKVPANLVVDGNTSLLLNLSAPKTQVDYATGSRAITFDSAGTFVSQAYQGAFTISTPGNFPSNSWTMELIVRLPYAATYPDQIPFLSWQANGESYLSSFFLDKGFGVRSRFYCWDTQDAFHVQPSAGGDGRSIQASANDKWVYLAFGADFKGQKYMSAARELTGEILNRDICFASKPWIDTNFLSNFAVSQQSAELARRWDSAGQRFTRGMPAQVTIGHALLQIKALRLSRGYKSELFEIRPSRIASDSPFWLPEEIDRTRAVFETVTRQVGYPGYRNTVPMQVTESYLPLSAGAAPISLSLSNLPVGLFSLEVYGQIDPKGRTALPRVWNPCKFDFQARNSSGAIIGQGKVLAKQGFVSRRMQEFHFHVAQPGTIAAGMRVDTGSSETARIRKVVLVDNLAGFPDKALKRSQNLSKGPSNKLATLTEQRKTRDNQIWQSLPPLNTHLQAHAQVAQFVKPPLEVTAEIWESKALAGLAKWQTYSKAFEPLDLTNFTTGVVFSHSNVVAGVSWPGKLPDDGTGTFFAGANYPSLAGNNSYYAKRAELLGTRYDIYLQALIDDPGNGNGMKLPLKYFQTGDAEIGHDAAMALVRLAYDWPALEMNLHEHRLNTHSPDFEYNTDWSFAENRNGKLYYRGWTGLPTEYLLTAYDQVFPYIQSNQVFAAAVNRFVPWVKTPDDVVRLLDRYLVWASVRDVNRGMIDASANVLDMAAQVLGPSPEALPLFDLTTQGATIYPLTGTYQELYGTALSRSGSYYIASFLTYANGSAQDLVKKAYMQKKAREAGVQLTMDLSDVNAYPKVRSAGSFILDMWVAGGFPFMVGDASGGPHTTSKEARNRLNVAQPAVENAFELYGDPRHAWLMANWWNNRDASVVSAAATVKNPVVHATSRVVPDYGAILEMAPQETNLLKKTAATLRLGIGQGHSHHDFLDLNLYAMGLPLAVDLACRNEGSFWSRPGANWSFLHNHALAHTSDDPSSAGAQTGEPWLRAFAPPMTRASYVEQAGTVKLDRDTVMVEVGDSGNFYCFDVQRLTGGTYHTWAFHGCESEGLQLNVPMQNKTVRWIDRTLEGTHKVGLASNLLQATWTMTRRTNAYPHTFNGGGVIETVAAEPTILGSDYNPNLPPVNVRATLLGRGADVVMQGNPYSDVYAYSFPFLWVQATNRAESVYPAVYEWYRGTTPVISNATILSAAPLRVQVRTTSGQEDVFEFNQQNCLTISRDNMGVRWLKLSGSRPVETTGVSLTPGSDYLATISSINYKTRTLTTSVPLPKNPSVAVGNGGRRIFLKLRGEGKTFTWDDDLLVHEGQLTTVRVTSTDTVTMTANQQVLFAGAGNRKAESMTVVNETGDWHFRGGRVISKPSGAALSVDVFTDANQDGFVNIKTYEIGVGDEISLPAEVELKRSTAGWRVKSNVPLQGTLYGIAIQVGPGEDWQTVNAVIPPVVRPVKPL